MTITIPQLRAARTTTEIDEALANLVLPEVMTVENFIVQLLDTYFTAQAIHNTGKPTGSQIDFVKAPTISNPKLLDNAAQYSLDKSYIVRARVNATLSSVEPVMQ